MAQSTPTNPPLSTQIRPGAVRVDPYRARISGVDPLYGQRVEDLGAHDRRQYEEWVARENTERLRVGEEELRKNELERAQFLQQQRSTVAKAVSGKVKPPSLIAYFVWGYTALIVDILDFVEFFIGYGAGLSTLVATIIAIIFIVISYIASGRINKLQKRSDVIQSHTQHLNQRITAYRQKHAQVKRILKKTAAGRAVRKGVAKSLRTIRRSPLGKSILSNIMQIIPLIDLLPWQLFNVYAVYKDHKQSYLDYTESINNNKITQQEEATEFAQSQAGEAEDIAAEAGDTADEYDEAA